MLDIKEGIRVMGGKVHVLYGKLFEAKWGQSNLARGFFRWPGYCFDRPLSLVGKLVDQVLPRAGFGMCCSLVFASVLLMLSRKHLYQFEAVLSL